MLADIWYLAGCLVGLFVIIVIVTITIMFLSGLVITKKDE